MKRRSLIAGLATLPVMARAQPRDPQRLVCGGGNLKIVFHIINTVLFF